MKMGRYVGLQGLKETKMDSVFELMRITFKKRQAYEVAAEERHAAASRQLPLGEFARLCEVSDLAFEAYRKAARATIAAYNAKEGGTLKGHSTILDGVYESRNPS